MDSPLTFVRTLFVFFSLCLFAAFSFSGKEASMDQIFIAVMEGFLFAGSLIGLELALKSLNLRTFNLAAIGLVFGYLMGQALLIISSMLIDVPWISLSEDASYLLKAGIFLFACYFGVILTIKASEQLNFSIPFIQLKPMRQKRKDILLDVALLSDARLIDLANSGLLDQQLILPRFAIKDLHMQAESMEEGVKTKARKSLESLKKLEGLLGLEIRFIENDIPDCRDPYSKLLQIARQIEANILTADINKLQQAEMPEGLKIININFLSQALKPLPISGKHIQIRIQRIGREPLQGVGYLDDGTMVVVNGGAKFIGEIIKASVLSFKDTSSGRMIFCNAIDEEYMNHEYSSSPKDLETTSLLA